MRYRGGKNGAGVYQRIISLMPPHRVYVEAFAGSGAVLRRKRPAAENHAWDLSPDAVRRLRQATAGRPGAWRVEVADALDRLAAFPWRGGEVVYLDPPYPFAVRSSGRAIYEHELSDDDHQRLLALLLALPAGVRVLLSSYRNDAYDEALADWRVIEYPAITRGGRVALEAVYLNFPEPAELHDYRYLGDNYTDRQRIRRKQARWRERLAAMPAQERYAMLAVLQELRGEEPEPAAG